MPDWFLYTAFANMACQENCHHTFQILTKRAWRMYEFMDQRDIVENIYAHWHSVSGSPAEMRSWPLPNVWLGTSVENKKTLRRIHHLKDTPAKVRFLSIEPLLEPVATELEPLLYNIDWIIVGGESGPNARPMKTAWVRDIRDICLAKGIPFFFKQWGGRNKKAAGRVLDGRTWDEMPICGGEQPF